METRPFGKTGETFPILSFGGQRIVDAHGCTEDMAIEIVNSAIDRGIRYFDTAWIYSDGQAETRLGKVVKHRRSEMWIATKTWDTTRDGARRQLEESLTRLQTDHVNEWRLHNVHSYERLDAMTAPDGALKAAVAAKEEGLIGNISISGHTDPQILVEALRRFPFDTALVAVSALDHFLYSFAEEFLPVAARKQVGVVGMKIFAYKRLADTADRALRYALSLPLTTVVVGSVVTGAPPVRAPRPGRRVHPSLDPRTGTAARPVGPRPLDRAQRRPRRLPGPDRRPRLRQGAHGAGQSDGAQRLRRRAR